MAKRVLIAGVVGGLVIFVWGFLAHEVIGLGEVGIKELPNEQTVTTALHATITEPGLYFFPGVGMSTGASAEQQKAAMEKATGGAYGLLIYHPSGAEFITPRRLVVEFALNVAEVLIAALLLVWAGGIVGYASRVGFVFVAGLLASLGTNIEYWNWYSFPGSYTAAYITTQVVGFLLAGLVVAALAKSPAKAARSTAGA